MTLTTANRETLGRLADELIPSDDKMPSASQADVMGRWLDQVLAARPDLEPPLIQLLDDANAVDAATVIAQLSEGNEAAFGVLTEVVCGAYFMNPKVQTVLGYAGQTSKEIDPRPDYMEDGLLESVIRRGPIYRPTPDTEVTK